MLIVASNANVWKMEKALWYHAAGRFNVHRIIYQITRKASTVYLYLLIIPYTF